MLPFPRQTNIYLSYVPAAKISTIYKNDLMSKVYIFKSQKQITELHWNLGGLIQTKFYKVRYPNVFKEEKNIIIPGKWTIGSLRQRYDGSYL